MKNTNIIYSLAWIWMLGTFSAPVSTAELDGIPIDRISDVNPKSAQSSQETTVHVQRIDADGRTIAEYDMTILRIDPNSQIIPPDPNDPAIHFESLIYDNTLDTNVWYPPGALSEVYDYGTSGGGMVSTINFGYVTSSFMPITLALRFYSGTSSSLCPGEFQGGWIFSGLDGSFFGLPELIAYEYVVPLDEQFNIPPGAFGYSCQFADYESGLRLTMGGLGNEDSLWQDCQPISFSNSWAGAYLRIYAEGGVGEHCYDPPQFDDVLFPSAVWQTTGEEQFGIGGCRLYQMFLHDDQKYDFSLCGNDGVGSFSLGDSDLEMLDAGGSLLWYLDGQADCGWAATTLGTSLQGWSPPTDGAYYLRISEFFQSSLQYNLAYRAAELLDPNLRVEPTVLEFSCPDPNIDSDGWHAHAQREHGSSESPISREAASSEQSEFVAQPPPAVHGNADPLQKLILPEHILDRLNSRQAKARVIVNLKRPPELKRKLKRRPRSVGWGLAPRAQTKGLDGTAKRVRYDSAKQRFAAQHEELGGGIAAEERRAWREIRNEIAAKQFEVLSTLTPRDFRQRRRFANLNSFSGEVTAEGLIKLLDNPRVKSIEPVIEVHAHLRQGIPLMNALQVRENYHGQNMAVAIVDTGIDYTHSALGGGGFPNTKVLGGYDFGDDDPDPFAGHSHGTNCAGIAAGDLADVGDYIGGVAHQARLYALKIAPGTTGSASSDDMIAAWDWCVTHQYDDPNCPIMVISTSFGGGRYFSDCDNADSAMAMAAENANAAGITLLCSSGNDGWCDSLSWPACISSVISVGAVYDTAFGSPSWCIDGGSCASISPSIGCSTGWVATDSTAPDIVAVYSNTAPFLDIFAPSNQAYTTSIGGYVSNFGGTSAACPYAAGAVACLQSAAQDILGQYLTPEEVRQILTESGDPITDTKTAITKSRVNLAKAVELISCNGQALYLYNDGEAILDVNDVITPDWITLTPEPPYSIPGGSRKRICVEADCNQCQGHDLTDVLQIFSSDPNYTAAPREIIVNLLCASPALLGDFDADHDVDLFDYATFTRHWLRDDCEVPDWCSGADLDRDHRVNLLDLKTFLDAWNKPN